VFDVKPTSNTPGVSRFSTEKWSMFDSSSQPQTPGLPQRGQQP